MFWCVRQRATSHRQCLHSPLGTACGGRFATFPYQETHPLSGIRGGQVFTNAHTKTRTPTCFRLVPSTDNPYIIHHTKNSFPGRQPTLVITPPPHYIPQHTHSGSPANLNPTVPILLQQLDPTLPVPSYAHPGDAGADLYSRIDTTLKPGERLGVPTGIAIALPTGYAAWVTPRSGLALRSGISVVNTPGLIDAGYRGEIVAILINQDPAAEFVIRHGDRIAQLVIQQVQHAHFTRVDRLPDSVRGVAGFGSTGQ